jgi:hypothetical protein
MLRAQVFRITLSAIFCGALGSSIVAAHHSVAPSDRGSVKPAVWDAHWSWVPGTVIRPFECEVK